MFTTDITPTIHLQRLFSRENIKYKANKPNLPYN